MRKTLSIFFYALKNRWGESTFLESETCAVHVLYMYCTCDWLQQSMFENIGICNKQYQFSTLLRVTLRIFPGVRWCSYSMRKRFHVCA